MRNRHLQVDADAQLFARIQKRVNEEVPFHRASFKITLFGKLIFYGGSSVVFYFTLFQGLNPWLFIVNYILLGLILLLFAFNFAHDFSHSAVFRSKRLNSLGFIGIYTLVGAHAEAWRERHIHSHHFAPNVKAYDSDLQITHLIRVGPDIPFRWYHRFQFLYAPIAYSSYSLYWIFVKDFTLLRQHLKVGRVSIRYLLSFFAQKVFYISYLLILPLLYTGQSWSLVLLAFLCMHLIQSVFLLFTFFMTHHVMETTYPETDENGIIQSSWLMNQIQSSNDMHPFSRTANFILGGFNNHIAHHLFPHIHHIHYPKLNRVLYRELREVGIVPNQTSYWGGVLSHLRILKKMGTV